MNIDRLAESHWNDSDPEFNSNEGIECCVCHCNHSPDEMHEVNSDFVCDDCLIDYLEDNDIITRVDIDL